MSEVGNLAEDLRASTRELRGALTALIAGLGLDARRASELARGLRLDKSLAWKIASIIKSDEPSDTLKFLPGAAAFDIVVSAAQNSGARAESVERAAQAYRTIQVVVSKHTGDRPTLELVLDSVSGRPAERLLLSRKLAFRGNSGVWGVQAKTRINTAFVAPSPDAPDMIDIVNIGGWVDFRRLRADSRWAMFRVQTFDAADAESLPYVPIDPQQSPNGPMLLREFCSSTMPPITSVQDENGDVVYELGATAIGNSGAFSCFYGSRIPRISSRFASPEGQRGEYAATISAPVEALQFDLFIHRDCEFATEHTTEVYGILDLTPTKRHERDLIPLELTRVDLGRFPPVVDTPRVAAYGKLIDYAMARCGLNPHDFIGIRYILEYPPFPSTVLISHPLDRAP
jgi:hypothetical protein